MLSLPVKNGQVGVGFNYSGILLQTEDDDVQSRILLCPDDVEMIVDWLREAVRKHKEWVSGAPRGSSSTEIWIAYNKILRYKPVVSCLCKEDCPDDCEGQCGCRSCQQHYDSFICGECL